MCLCLCVCVYLIILGNIQLKFGNVKTYIQVHDVLLENVEHVLTDTSLLIQLALKSKNKEELLTNDIFYTIEIIEYDQRFYIGSIMEEIIPARSVKRLFNYFEPYFKLILLL